MTNDIQFERKIMMYKLQKLKKESTLTYQQIGEGIGVDRSHVYRIMNDVHSSASLNLLVRLARFFEVPFYSLFLPAQEMREELDIQPADCFGGLLDQEAQLRIVREMLQDVGVPEDKCLSVLEYLQDRLRCS